MTVTLPLPLHTADKLSELRSMHRLGGAEITKFPLAAEGVSFRSCIIVCHQVWGKQDDNHNPHYNVCNIYIYIYHGVKYKCPPCCWTNSNRLVPRFINNSLDLSHLILQEMNRATDGTKGGLRVN